MPILSTVLSRSTMVHMHVKMGNHGKHDGWGKTEQWDILHHVISKTSVSVTKSGQKTPLPQVKEDSSYPD